MAKTYKKGGGGDTMATFQKQMMSAVTSVAQESQGNAAHGQGVALGAGPIALFCVRASRYTRTPGCVHGPIRLAGWARWAAAPLGPPP